jgi:chitinase
MQPWIRSSYTGQVVTYDDPDSLSMKAQFARQSGLRGCNMFSMDGDWTGSNWPLVDALRSGMGI